MQCINNDLILTDMLEEKATFVYCGKRESWYWSVGRHHWENVDTYVITGGTSRGMRPRDADVMIMDKLRELRVENTRQVTQKPCALCTYKVHLYFII